MSFRTLFFLFRTFFIYSAGVFTNPVKHICILEQYQILSSPRHVRPSVGQLLCNCVRNILSIAIIKISTSNLQKYSKLLQARRYRISRASVKENVLYIKYTENNSVFKSNKLWFLLIAGAHGNGHVIVSVCIGANGVGKLMFMDDIVSICGNTHILARGRPQA